MARLPLTSGAYKSRSLIANAQRCVNLFPEINPEATRPPVPVTHLMRPGNRLLMNAPAIGAGRGLYCASNGAVYMVAGPNVYYVNNNWQATLLGNIGYRPSIVSMADNGTDVLLVDGTPNGYVINLAANNFTQINDTAFYGGDRVEYVGSAFMLNRPGTSQFYVSSPNSLIWNPLYFGQKTASPDPLVAAVAVNNQAWLLGTLKGEIWYYSGAAAFPWQQLPGVLIEHGLGALYSPATTDKFVFWLTQDKDGKPWVARGSTDYSIKKVSTFAIDDEIQGYRRWNDAVGYIVQQLGHTFYVINFPSADKTWVYDLATDQWHERAAIDINGVLHRERPQLQVYAYNTNIVIDWQTGALLESNPNIYRDPDFKFPCIRSFPHVLDKLNRISYKNFVADVETGTIPNVSDAIGNPWSSGFSSGFGPFRFQMAQPKIYLSQSIDRGRSYRTKRGKTLGATGKFKTIVQWWRLDMARDSVFQVEWAEDAKISLNGAFLEAEGAET